MTKITDISEYEYLIIGLQILKEIELDILHEALLTWKQNPGNPYYAEEIREGKQLAAFCIYYRSPNTEYSFDIHTFCVGINYKHTAIADKLLQQMEQRILRENEHAVLRIETSLAKENAIREGFYNNSGFQELGHIPSYYDFGNDYYIYSKSISR